MDNVKQREKELAYPRRAKDIGNDLINYGNLLIESARWENIPDRPYMSKYISNRVDRAARELRELVEYMESDDAN